MNQCQLLEIALFLKTKHVILVETIGVRFMIESMVVSEITTVEERKMVFDLTRIRIKSLEGVVEQLEIQEKGIDTILNQEKENYEVSFNQQQDREISIPEFSEIDQAHRHKLDSLHLKKLSLQMAMDAKKSVIQRLWCLCWLLKMPSGKMEAQATRHDTGEKITVRRQDIYKKYMNTILKAEGSRLKNEQDYLRLLLDFNHIPDILVHPEHEFYAESSATSEKLINVKEQIEIYQQYENNGKRNYQNTIDFNQLTVGDFMNENTEYLFEQFFIENEEKRRAV